MALTYLKKLAAGLFWLSTGALANEIDPSRQSFHAGNIRTTDSQYVATVPQQKSECKEAVSTEVYVDQGHPWAPPFGIDRVGAPLVARVVLTSIQEPRREYYVVTRGREQQSERTALPLRKNPSFRTSPEATKNASQYYGTVSLKFFPEEVVLYARCPHDDQVEELARRRVSWPLIEAEVVARPDRQNNPVDLGAILVPHDWLLIVPRQTVLLGVAAFAHERNIPGARLRAWFEGGEAIEASMPLAMGMRVIKEVSLRAPSGSDTALLYVSITDGAHELWGKEVHTMVAQRRRWPAFGAVETKLRYDSPIPVHDPDTGAPLPSIDYEVAWDRKLNDVVVFLPNGGRFVFWRGSSYVPFWAGPNNIGMCYQWAENLTIPVRHSDGSVDLPEPLFDQQLRYGRVTIVESTPSRVHVRWTYQLTDVHYNIWGDQATEDYYFYPDGFGTRTVTVMSDPDASYQLTEFIILTPQSAFPLEVLPTHMADVLFLDGEKKSIWVPLQGDKEVSAGQPVELVSNPRRVPMVYRFFAHKNDPAAALYFSPRDATTPGAYWPFYDQGQMVTPTYWGSHWPLRRGKWTHWRIDDGIYSGPAHNSVAGWLSMPAPLSVAAYSMPNTLGRSQSMTMKRWTALIAKTDAPDDVLLDWARSFSDPPSLQVAGARIDFPSYSPERRSIRLVAESSLIKIKLQPSARTVNPVLELRQAPKELISVAIDGRMLPASAYAWDGATLWMNATIGSSGAEIAVSFR